MEAGTYDLLSRAGSVAETAPGTVPGTQEAHSKGWVHAAFADVQPQVIPISFRMVPPATIGTLY